MQEREDTMVDPFQGGNLVPSCAFDTDGDSMPDRRAWAPRRIVEVARGMGSQGMIGSICQVDLRDPVDGFLETIARTLDGATDPGIPGVCDPFLPQGASQSGAGPTGPRCNGVAEPCLQQANEPACAEVQGCFWSNVSKGCTGSTRSCADYPDQSGCSRQPGCSWR
jgi:hypothetical protein